MVPEFVILNPSQKGWWGLPLLAFLKENKRSKRIKLLRRVPIISYYSSSSIVFVSPPLDGFPLTATSSASNISVAPPVWHIHKFVNFPLHWTKTANAFLCNYVLLLCLITSVLQLDKQWKVVYRYQLKPLKYLLSSI